MNDCIFCKIARGEMDAEMVHEEDEVLAFKDIRGLAPQLPETVARRLFEVASEVAQKLGVRESGYAVRINNGPDAGQGVFHLHLHVLGGKNLGMP